MHQLENKNDLNIVDEYLADFGKQENNKDFSTRLLLERELVRNNNKQSRSSES